MDNNEIKNYYNATANEYSKMYFDELNNKPFDRLFLKRFSELTKSKGKVCDVGCGPGEVARFLKDIDVDVFGIDISDGMIKEAQRLNPDIIFKRGNMMALEFQDEELIGISASYSIVNLKLNEVELSLKEFYRVIKLNGYLMLSFHIGSNETIKVEKKIDDVNYPIEFMFFDFDHIKAMLEEIGFEIEEAVIRYPYKNVEYQSRRGYIIAKRGGTKW